MIRKWLLVFAILLVSQASFAVEKADLNLDFFSRFNDDCLNYYINSAFENNHEAKQAAARVEQYRQQAKYSLGAELPSFSVSANYLGIKVPELDNFAMKKNAFVLPFMVNYEADFLLKNRDKTKAVKKDYEAVQYDERAVYLALLSDVATVYTNILQYDELIKMQKDIVEFRREILVADSKKFSRGVINFSEFNNSQKSLESEKNTLEDLEKQRDILLMQLAVLTGVSSDCISDLQRGSFDSFEYKNTIPSEVLSDVIFSRPDVLAAEKRLEKAKIDIRVARKEFLPTFNIVGLWAFNTIAPGTFFSWESSLALLLAGASQDIFMGGRKVANLRLKKARYEELFEAYKQTDLEAVKEVNTSLCLIKHDTKIDDNTKLKLKYSAKNFNDAQKKFNRGVISYPVYLNEHSILISQEKEAVQSKTRRIVNYFTLYKAVGGQL